LDRIEAKETNYLYINESQIPGSGKGLFTSIPIYKGEIISIFKGEILGNAEAKLRAENGKDQYFIIMLDGSIMDSKNTKCFAKYANDADGFIKTQFRKNSTITLDDDENICLVATKDLLSGEEVFCSYGKRYWKKHAAQFNKPLPYQSKTGS